ncbi:MAG: NAD(P)H-hydrate dehydratase [Pseudomonadota bacterium]
MRASQVLTSAQMRGAEEALFAAGMSPFALMERAASAAAEWVRRIAAGRPITVLSGPGNNGGDGYVIARECKRAGLEVQVVAPLEPKTDQARQAREIWLSLEEAKVLSSGKQTSGGVLVDCLFGSGLTRPLIAEHALLLRDLARRHGTLVAIDLPSGIASDTGEVLTESLAPFDVTLALGAWKYAHCFAGPRPIMGVMRLLPIGIDEVEGAAKRIERPAINPPESSAHKYTRGLCAVIAGSMPGAAVLAASAATRAGAGYVRVMDDAGGVRPPPSLVLDDRPLDAALGDKRIAAMLVGPGLGQSTAARGRLATAMETSAPLVLDADALTLLEQSDMDQRQQSPVIATPHDGELSRLCSAFNVIAEGRMDRARGLARASGMVVVAKGPDTFVACPEGRLAIGPPASSWLSVAGTGDVLAGVIASRLSTGSEPFDAACQGVWLHGETAQLCGPAFTPEGLAKAVSSALSRCLVQAQ